MVSRVPVVAVTLTSRPRGIGGPSHAASPGFRCSLQDTQKAPPANSRSPAPGDTQHLSPLTLSFTFLVPLGCLPRRVGPRGRGALTSVREDQHADGEATNTRGCMMASAGDKTTEGELHAIRVYCNHAG